MRYNPTMKYQQASFLISAAKLSQLPKSDGIEVAFAGRSNAGKSSTLNALCQQKNLAKTSKTPGRTRLINLFELAEDKRLVDLPGYGYARVSKTMQADWQKTLGGYLEKRECLKGVVLIMDLRHPFQKARDQDVSFDGMMVDWSRDSGLPLHILLNKCDKLSKSAATNVLLGVRKLLADHPNVTAQLFSTTKRTGIDELKGVLDAWYSA
tara:strand:- start:3088 stop:3714 length:627 start_codon:yes stop_codon:yes gene_type:complete